MTLVQVDFWKFVEYLPNDDERYYWSTVYYLDTDDFDDIEEISIYCQHLEEVSNTELAFQWYVQIKSPPGRTGVIYEQNIYTGQGGLWPDDGDHSLIMIARWTLISSTGRKTYRLHRMPIPNAYMDGPNWTPTGLGILNSQLASLLAEGKCRNSYGELLVGGSISSTPRMWQLRHGTARRNRVPGA